MDPGGETKGCSPPHHLQPAPIPLPQQWVCQEGRSQSAIQLSSKTQKDPNHTGHSLQPPPPPPQTLLCGPLVSSVQHETSVSPLSSMASRAVGAIFRKFLQKCKYVT